MHREHDSVPSEPALTATEPCRARPSRRGFLSATLAGLATASATEAAGEQPPEGDAVKQAVDRALDQCRQRARDGRMEEQAAYGKALVARFGSDVVDTIRETTIARARGWLAEADIPHRDLDAVKTQLWDRLPPGFTFKLLEQTPGSLRFKVTRCPLAEKMRSLDAAEVGFAYHCAYDYGFCQGLNPAIRFTRTKTLMEGADCCDHAYSLDASPVPGKEG